MIDQNILNKLLKFGVDRGASDIHFEVGGPPRYRIRGDLLKAKFDPLTADATHTIASILLGDRQVDLSRMFPEQDASYSIPRVSRFRVSVFRQRGSIGCVLRVIPFEIRDMTELGLPASLRDVSNTRRGLILVTGATGNGKSTTIAAMLHHINNTRQAHVITIEDPIEFLFDNNRCLFVQREIGTDTYSYGDAMVAALRQDPDIIMLGEVRDESTANICLKAAETGHLVISTLHTPDVNSTIKRFLGFFEQNAQVQLSRFAEALQAVVCLRLIPRADGKGRIPAVEVLRVTHTVQECIRNPDKHLELYTHMARGRDMYGMQTFDQHLVDLVRNNMAAQDVAKMAATRPDEFERALLVD